MGMNYTDEPQSLQLSSWRRVAPYLSPLVLTHLRNFFIHTNKHHSILCAADSWIHSPLQHHFRHFPVKLKTRLSLESERNLKVPGPSILNNTCLLVCLHCELVENQWGHTHTHPQHLSKCGGMPAELTLPTHACKGSHDLAFPGYLYGDNSCSRAPHLGHHQYVAGASHR